MTIEETQGRLLDLLNHYAQQLEDLTKLLQEEHESLRVRDIVALENCTKKKHELLEHLETLESERKQVSNQLLEQMENDSTNVPTSRELKDLNNRVQSLLENCRHQNEINGAIIDISRQFSQRLLGIILGTHYSESIYNSAGQNATQLSAQSVARI